MTVEPARCAQARGGGTSLAASAAGYDGFVQTGAAPAGRSFSDRAGAVAGRSKKFSNSVGNSLPDFGHERPKSCHLRRILCVAR